MDSNLSINNALFYRSTGRDVTPLLQTLSCGEVDDKRSSEECKKLIVSAMSPQVCVYASEQADQVATKLQFHSLLQLLKPFGDRIEHKFQIKDSHFISKTIDEFSLRFVPPLEHMLSVQQAESGTKAQLFNYQSLELLMTEYIQLVDLELQKCGAEDKLMKRLLKKSIYVKFLTKLLASSSITSFESINQPVASFFFITGEESYEQARQMLIQYKSAKLPEYLSIDDIIPVFIIITDQTNADQQEKSAQLREHIKKQLFVEAFVLSLDLNSNDDSVPSVVLNPPILCTVDEELQNTHLSSTPNPSLPTANLTAIYQLLKDVIQKKLIPFMEKKITTWDEQVIVPRKSITGRLFNVSRKYFGSKRETPNELSGNYNSELGIYRYNSTQTLTKKLADWSFMLRDYRYSYTTYELAKKDFLNDKAWTHLASASEMAAISLLMGAANITSKLKNDTIDPLMDNSNYTYLARCGLKTYALRSILVVSELFCNLRDTWSNAPTAIKWVQKALNDKLVTKTGKVVLLERIGYYYSICISAQAKAIMTRKLITEKSQDEMNDDEDVDFVNPLKLNIRNIATMGNTRQRKSALFKLIAARNWDPVSEPLQVLMCLQDTKTVYQGTVIGEREGGLLKRLQVASEDKLSM